MTTLEDLAAFLNTLFQAHRYGGGQCGVCAPAARPVARLGLALEPWPQFAEWAESERLDAVFLHRPWKLLPGQPGEGVGILAYHAAFDEQLTLGFNPRLAAALGLSDVEPFGEKDGRPIGMLGAIEPAAFGAVRRTADDVFGGLDASHANARDAVAKVAVAGAMTEALVMDAAGSGADVYVTGQYRNPARRAVRQTGIGVLAVGHRRGEEWGLRTLSNIVRERWARVRTVLAPAV
jgi:putative NIF3 family GTP cyclohydrolase 1 type 2